MEGEGEGGGVNSWVGLPVLRGESAETERKGKMMINYSKIYDVMINGYL